MQVSEKNSITKEAASELDYVIAIDCSGSMTQPDPDRPGKSLFQHAEEWTQGMAAFADEVDDDGITVMTFGGQTVNVTDNVKADAVRKVFADTSPFGGTPTHEVVERIVSMKKSNKLTKNVVAFIITDGRPSNPEAVAKAIAAWTKDANATEHGISFSFIQIGNDPGARAFLQMLDDDLESKYGAKFDCVDTRTLSEADGMTPGQLVWGAMND